MLSILQNWKCRRNFLKIRTFKNPGIYQDDMDTKDTSSNTLSKNTKLEDFALEVCGLQLLAVAVEYIIHQISSRLFTNTIFCTTLTQRLWKMRLNTIAVATLASLPASLAFAPSVNGPVARNPITMNMAKSDNDFTATIVRLFTTSRTRYNDTIAQLKRENELTTWATSTLLVH